ncbi:MAG: hypothetical protein D5R99_09475 [Methanocalculus sp. MSAO_Arc1]|uniref:hypothetical protein n=1 Tax=Methanocalculus TaxID=71151 RepID=UPI000FF4E1A4|nr:MULTISPECIES: hypothetical protein [unclassified Methanocalculus]MCP1662592.1 hypothetical protein [Methanocalculus sp. AMF5]RQD78953.1 MAG: hypothetical protein D5R99_09475 [Methanocalculus sp. MSAO_Arc1]
MDSRQRLLIVGGAIACIGLAFIDLYLSFFAIVLVGVLYMSLWIMHDSASQPHVVCSLAEDAKSVIVRNVGTAPAKAIQVALVPHDIEFEVRELAPDEEYVYTLDKMLEKAKAVAQYSDGTSSQPITHSYPLSSLDGEAYDPLKPMIPLFGWGK